MVRYGLRFRIAGSVLRARWACSAANRPGRLADPSGQLQCMLKPEHGWLLIRPDAYRLGELLQASIEELSDAAAFECGPAIYRGNNSSISLVQSAGRSRSPVSQLGEFD